MIFKPRGENTELELFRSLRIRKKLEVEDDNKFAYLEKGWLGEIQFDQLLLGLPNECLILNNLLLEINNSLFQIDSLLIALKKILIFEIKNNEGDYYFKNDRLHMISGKEIKNPLNQITRSESLFRQLLHELRFNMPIESHVIYINPEFYLYEAPVNSPFVFHSQLGRFMKNLESVAASGYSDGHLRLAEKLASLHITKNPFSRLPAFTYEELKKGIVGKCGCTFMEVANQNYLICPRCKELEHKESAVLRSVRELSLLFPDRKITVNGVMEWCGVISSKRIRGILLDNFTLVKMGKASYYLYPSEARQQD
ncbi:nuclease-related domain-containing protein [Bacillus sp. REN16]|uniref:nuclease-related domain-containing protein n=1 Tax=Bacillus sp. REN16 TaxID=2887296 RepID=UPI001E353FC8|nr:nuclease-related domain-containing protein [Bacillus sp. REN16]MCC3356613.1 NERD domain-containing protein [Bacillus sp. REN16]